jgi:hypothetical protein
MKCPPKPKLQYLRQCCCICTAVTEKDAETTCRPSSDETWGRFCGAEFDKEGYAVAPTIRSMEAQDAWNAAHFYCGDECVAAKHSPHWPMAAVIVGPVLALIIAAFFGH